MQIEVPFQQYPAWARAHRGEHVDMVVDEKRGMYIVTPKGQRNAQDIAHDLAAGMKPKISRAGIAEEAHGNDDEESTDSPNRQILEDAPNAAGSTPAPVTKSTDPLSADQENERGVADVPQNTKAAPPVEETIPCATCEWPMHPAATHCPNCARFERIKAQAKENNRKYAEFKQGKRPHWK